MNYKPNESMLWLYNNYDATFVDGANVISLHLDIQNFEITIEGSNANQTKAGVISVKQAKQLWNAEVVEAYNVPFGRLVEHNFSIDSVLDYYE